MQGTAEQKAMVQDAVNRFWWKCLAMFGLAVFNHPNRTPLLPLIFALKILQLSIQSFSGFGEIFGSLMSADFNNRRALVLLPASPAVFPLRVDARFAMKIENDLNRFESCSNHFFSTVSRVSDVEPDS